MGRVIEAFAQFLDGDGDPLRNGWLRFLESGTTNTDKTTYFDDAFQIPNENPLQLDGSGRCPNVFGTGNYKVISYVNDPEDEDSPGEMIQTFDPVTAQGATTGGGGGSAGFEDWDNTETYSIGDIVSYNNLFYRSLANGNLGNIPPATSSYWEQIDFVHYWNDTVYYEAGDIVYFDGALYFSKQNLNTNQQPDEKADWWFRILTDYTAIDTKDDDYSITTADYGKLLVLSGNLVAKAFELPATDATIDRFYISFYNASDYDLTIDLPFGSSDNIWLETSLAIEKGALVGLVYNYALSTWVVERGNAGPVLGNQILGTATNPIANIIATSATITNFAADAIRLGDDKPIYFGDSDDCSIFYESAGNDFEFHTNATGVFHFFFGTVAHWVMETPGTFRPASTNPTPQIGTTTYRPNAYLNNVYLADSDRVYFGTGNDASIYHNGSNGYFDCASALYFRVTTANHMYFYVNGSEVLELEDTLYAYFKSRLYVASNAYITGTLSVTSTSTFTGKVTANGGVRLNDSDILELGSSADMEIFHNGTNGYIDCNTGDLYFRKDTTTAFRIESSDSHIYFAQDIHMENNDIFLDTADSAFISVASVIFSGAMVLAVGSGASIAFATNSTARWYVSSSGHFYPNGNNLYDIGSSATRVRTIYSVNALDVSDSRLKYAIHPTELGLDFINALKPVSFRLREEENGRTRYGLIAQEVEETITKFGLDYIDFSALHYDKSEDRWDIDYTHFIAILIKAVQEMDAKLTEHGIFL